jgi:hypothetical protein
MADQEETSAKNELNTPNSDIPSPSGEDVDASGSKKKDGENESNEQPHKHQIVVHVQPPENSESNEIARQSNVIAKDSIRWVKWSLLVNAVLVLFTFAALFLTNRSVTISSEALDDSRNKASEDSLNRIKDRYDDSVNTARRFSLDSISTDAQIKALQETAKQFIISNEPFLQIQCRVF